MVFTCVSAIAEQEDNLYLVTAVGKHSATQQQQQQVQRKHVPKPILKFHFSNSQWHTVQYLGRAAVMVEHPIPESAILTHFGSFAHVQK